MKSRKPLEIIELFFLSMIACIIAYIIVAFFSNGNSFIHSLFTDSNDVFMDFFNSICDSINSYADSNVIYPPFINLCFRILGGMIVPYSIDAFDSRTTVVGSMTYAFFVMLVTYVIFTSVKKIYHGQNKNLLMVLVIFSMPFLFCIERGNIIIVAALLLLPFIQWYDSEDKTKRYIGYICLALSVNIKLYPIVFGILILKNKQYREFIIFAVITLIIFFVSLFLLQDSLIDFIHNIFNTTSVKFDGVGISNVVHVLMMAFASNSMIKIVSYAIMAIVLIASAYLILFNDMERWKTVMLLSLLLCTCGTFNQFYCLVYMFIPLIMFLNTNPERNRENLIYVAFFILMMAPMIGFHSDFFNADVNLSLIINGFVPTIALFYLLITEFMKMKKNDSIDAKRSDKCSCDKINSQEI